jgi:hypothetical protein
MTLDPLILSRLQFVWVIGWHILLPAFTIGLASFIAAMEGAHIVTGREVLFWISSFWIKIFSVAFGMGVVSGICDALPVRHQLEPVLRSHGQWPTALGRTAPPTIGQGRAAP